MDNIVANFRIADDVDAPKIKRVRTGYAPHHKFPNVDYFASGVHSYDDQELHYPGETLEVRISFPSWEHFRNAVKVGDSFEVRELDRLVGYGTVVELL
ncbi:hypothetical protein [Burkholderia ubonensis]|uniref:hypothetical protein n=1 Tax=Burkholderia ubonensis TaxID=101571 RepID=UPI0018DF6365|nr:hypothetical protein [Burkholderia ubonensis]